MILVFEYLADTYLKGGGARNSGDKAVMDITDGSADHKSKAAAAAAANTTAASTNGTANAQTTVTTNTAADLTAPNGASNKPFTLEASTQRTGGKKSGPFSSRLILSLINVSHSAFCFVIVYEDRL